MDGEYFFPASIDAITEFSLKKGQDINEDKIKKILNEDLYYKILDKTLGFISYQMRTNREIEDRISQYLYKALNNSKHSEGIKKRVIKKVNELGFVDDEAFAKSYVQIKKESKIPPGKRKIHEFLMKKGVGRETIEKILNEYQYETELKGAEKAADKKLKTLKGNDSYKNKNRLWKFLAGKGYSSDVIRAVVDMKFKV